MRCSPRVPSPHVPSQRPYVSRQLSDDLEEATKAATVAASSAAAARAAAAAGSAAAVAGSAAAAASSAAAATAAAVADTPPASRSLRRPSLLDEHGSAIPHASATHGSGRLPAAPGSASSRDSEVEAANGEADAAAQAQADSAATAEVDAAAGIGAREEADAAPRSEAQRLASVAAAAKAEAQAFARLATEAKAEVEAAARVEARARAMLASASASASAIAGLAAAAADAAASAEAAANADAQAPARQQAAGEAQVLEPANLSPMTDERLGLGPWQRRMLAAREAPSGLQSLLRGPLAVIGALGAVLVAVAVAVARKGSVKDGMAAEFEKSDPSWHVILLPTHSGARRGVQTGPPSGPRGPRPQLNSAEAVKQLLLSISLLTMSASPNVTADYRIRQADIAPTLGRGYSLTTYDVLSTCLNFTEKAMDTQSFDHTMLEFTHDGKCASDVSESMEGSASWGFVRSTISAAVDATPDNHSKYFVATRMPTERYSSRIDDKTATLTPDALALVESGDLVGFFQTCGTGFISSIRRTAELAAVFEFSSSSVQSSQEMAAEFKGSGLNRNMLSKPSGSNTTIQVKGFGLGLNPEGADMMVAHNFEDYNNALKFAKSAQSDGIGMIHTLEVESWADNLQFKNAINFRAQQQITYETTPGGTDVRSVAREGDGQPVMVDAVEVKAITMMNAELITGLEAIYHKEMYTIAKFIACQGELSAMVGIGRGDSDLLDHTRKHMSVSAQSEAESVTVAEAETILSLRQLASRIYSLRAFVKHFYGRCATQLAKYSDAGGMTKYWWDFDECMPTANGTQQFSLECLDADRSFEHDGNQLTCPARQTIGQKPYGLDAFIDKFCMPEIDSGVLSGSDDPAPPPPHT